MLIAQLTRYEPCRTIYGWKDEPDCRPCAIGEYVKFDEAMEASLNSLQQLKAEIAKEAVSLELNSGDTTTVRIIADRLLKLSAD